MKTIHLADRSPGRPRKGEIYVALCGKLTFSVTGKETLATCPRCKKILKALKEIGRI